MWEAKYWNVYLFDAGQWWSDKREEISAADPFFETEQEGDIGCRQTILIQVCLYLSHLSSEGQVDLQHFQSVLFQQLEI